MEQRNRILRRIRVVVFFWLFVCVASLSLSLGAAYRAGRLMGRGEQPQLLSTNKDLMQVRKKLQAQLSAVEKALFEVTHDMRTHPHTRMQLELVLEKCRIREELS